MQTWNLSTCLQCSSRVDCTVMIVNVQTVTMIPWEMDEQLVWDVTVVDAIPGMEKGL